MPAQNTSSLLRFQALGGRKVEADFSAGHITSDAGGLLLSELEATTHVISRFASCFFDHRDPELIEHSVLELVGQRIYGLVLGYEDLNDHELLRVDPLLATIVGKLDPTGASRRRVRDRGKPLAGKSTLNRLELTPPGNGDDRYKRIVYQPDAIDELYVSVFVENFGESPEEIILDFDTTNDPIHGSQEGSFFHGYYEEYCYLPLYVFCGHDLLLARLNTADIGPAKAALAELPALVSRLRRHWPDVSIIVRGDSAFSTEALMSWCESNNVLYIFGLSKNTRLLKELQPFMEEAKELFEQQSEQLPLPIRCFHDFEYTTVSSWSQKRRVIGKAEHLQGGPNPRFIVTSLSETLWDAQSLYEDLYCARGDMENRLKEQQLGMFADRTSAETIRANQLRLHFSSLAYTIVNLLRKLALKGTELATAQVGTIRLKLFKVGALVRVSVRRVWIQCSSAFPLQSTFTTVLERLRSRLSSTA